MPFTRYRVTIKAPAALVWSLLLDKVERPDRYVPGVQSVTIAERLDSGAVRRVMVVGDGDRTKTVRELISVDEPTRTVIFKLDDDPVYSGFVTNTLFDEDGAVALDYTLNWTPRGPAPPAGPDWEAAIKGAVLHTKDLAEQKARGADA